MTDKIISNKIGKQLKKFIPGFNEEYLEQVSLYKSVTNRFLQYRMLHHLYLLRLNGQLWPPFTREMEHNNLSILSQHHFPTNVVYNNVSLGFQLCMKEIDTKTFNDVTNQQERLGLLPKIAKLMRRYHEVSKFENHYAIHQTIYFSLLKSSFNQMHFKLSEIVYQLLLALYLDTENYVSSHNDLLPSSVLINKNKNIAIVDWEYASINHRALDIAHFSTTASLTQDEEDSLMSSYAPLEREEVKQSVILAKPVINLLLLLWNKDESKSCLLYSLLVDSIAKATQKVSLREYSFFYHKNLRKNENKEEVEAKHYFIGANVI